MQQNDAAAMPAVFTEDAVQVAPEGLFSGRQAIEKRYGNVFQRLHLTNDMNPPRVSMPWRASRLRCSGGPLGCKYIPTGRSGPLCWE